MRTVELGFMLKSGGHLAEPGCPTTTRVVLLTALWTEHCPVVAGGRSGWHTPLLPFAL